MLNIAICEDDNLFRDILREYLEIILKEVTDQFEIKEFNCGISVEAEDTEALKVGILRLLALPEEDRERLGENGRLAALNHFNYEALSKKFIELLETEVKEMKS